MSQQSGRTTSRQSGRQVAQQEAEKVKAGFCPEINRDIYFVKIYSRQEDTEYVEIKGRSGKIQRISEKEWEKLLAKKVKSILSKFVSGKVVDKMVSPATMAIWKRSFTDKSSEPDPLLNYEPLEKLGDRVMGSVFTEYIMKKFPAVDECQLNDLNRIYVSKPIQAEISAKIDLASYANRLGILTEKISMREDLLEAFFGAIIYAAEAAFNNPTIGYGIARNMVTYFYTPYKITLQDAVPPIQNEVKEALEKIGLKHYVEKAKGVNQWGEETLTMRIMIVNKESNEQSQQLIAKDDKLRQNLIENGIAHWNMLARDWNLVSLNLKYGNYILSEKTGLRKDMTKAVVEPELFAAAKEKLREYRLTYAKSDEMGDFLKLDRDYLYPYKDRLLAKLSDDGYQRPKFKRIQEDKKNIPFVTLFGVKMDGSQTSLVTAAGDDVQDAEIRAVCAYINN